MRCLILLGFIIINAVYLQAQRFTGNEVDIDIIKKNTEQFSSNVMASDYENIAAAYTEDAKIFPTNMSILEGDDIKKYWTLPDGMRTSYHHITQEEISVIDETAYDYGYYEGKTLYSDGREVEWKGKYVIVWKKVADDWKMYLDIWNGVAKPD